MKKLILLFSGLLFLSTSLEAQVIANFNNPATGVTGFEKSSDSGPGLDSLYWTHDPSNPSNGVMAITMKWDSLGWHGRMELGSAGNATYIAGGTAQYITFWVYIDSTQNVPDSLQIDTYAMDNTNWSWTEGPDEEHYAMDIPHNVWYPLSFPLAAAKAANPNFQYNAAGAGKGFMTGLQFFPHTGCVGWQGTIYVDNVAMVGALPHYVGGPGATGFEKSSDSGPGLDSVFTATDPAGGASSVVGMAFKWDSLSWHGRMDLGSAGNSTYFPGGAAEYFVSWIYLDSTQNVPDSLQIDTYAMDNTNWSWTEEIHFAKDIPHNVWYPLAFPLAAAKAANPNFQYNAAGAGKGFMTGLQLFPHDSASLNWQGVIYVSNCALLDTIAATAPPVWTAADFSAPGTGSNAGKQGFYVPSWASGTLTPGIDYNLGFYVLQGKADLSQGAKPFAAVRDSIPMMDAADSTALSISFGVYVPSKMPNNAVFNFYVSGGAGDSVASVDTLGVGGFNPGQLNTMTISKLDSLALAGKFDPTKPAQVGVTVHYPAPYDTITWSGTLEFTDLTITGIWFPNQLLDGIIKVTSNVPKEYKLYTNYPNPFNPSTIIQYDLPKNSKVVLNVYDVIGRLVATLVNKNQSAGTYQVTFNGDRFASGVYFVRLDAGSFMKTQKMLLLK